MQKPVTVLHLSASDKGGAYVMAANMVKEQKRQGDNALHLIYTGKLANIAITGIGFIDRFLKITLHAFEKLQLLLHEKDGSTRFKFSLGHPGIPYLLLKKHIRKADIIHIHWMNKGFINIRDLEKFGKPIVWTMHDIWAVTGGCHLTMGCTRYTEGCGHCPMLSVPDENDISALQVQVKQRVYGKAKPLLISPGKWMDNNVANSFLGQNIGHGIIKNGVDTAVFNYSEDQVFHPVVTIGFVAANLNDTNKALFRLAEALELVPDKSKFKLLLVGEQKTAFDFEIPCDYEIVSGINNPNDMAVLYRKMDVLAVTSTMETFPTTLMEGCCCGTLCIGFDVGGVGEIITPFIGQLIPAFDIRAFADGLMHFADSKMEKRHIAAYGAKNFSLAAMCDKYRALYLSMAE